MSTITKEELEEKLKAIESTYSQEERIKMLEEISKMLKEANQEMRDLYIQIKNEVDK